MATIQISAFDTLFVRDGKPFSMGEDTWASGIFPPPPSVFYGALRTRYFSEHPDQLRLANRERDPTGKLEIQKIGYLLREGNSTEQIFPAPYDLMIDKDVEDDDNSGLGLLRYEDQAPISSSELALLRIEGKDNIEATGGESFINDAQFIDYLNGKTPSSVIEKSKLWSTEPKLGIAKDRFTGSSQTGKLYRVGMVRPSQLDIYLTFTGLETEIAKSGMIKLGGEGKAAQYHNFDAENFEAPTPVGNRFKIYFATPALFKNGFLPNVTEGIWKKHDIRVLAVASGKPVFLGGFAMKSKNAGKGQAPKPMRKAVPAGSVYFVEVGGDISAAIEAIHGHCISDMFSDDDCPANQGFGLAYVALSHHQNF